MFTQCMSIFPQIRKSIDLFADSEASPAFPSEKKSNIRRWWVWWKNNEREKTEETRKINMFQCDFVHQKSHADGAGIETGPLLW